MNEKYVPPVSIFFIWHPQDDNIIYPLVKNCIKKLSHCSNAPFSKSVDIPIFIRTGNAKNLKKINKKSETTIAFYFLSKHLVADDVWREYVETEIQEKDIVSIPISLDAHTTNINLQKKNKISLNYRSDSFNMEATIRILHETYRWLLSTPAEGKGKDHALKIFLSHTKKSHHTGEEPHEQRGFILAESLKNAIDHSPMKSFFDMYDIGIGNEFDKDMLANIPESTFLAIHCDEYSSRYWCQTEFLHAKSHFVPIVAVDIANDFEDRRFPYSSNVPCIYVNFESSPDHMDILRILEACLIETIRFNYSKLQLETYKKIGWIDHDYYVLSRPPEALDLLFFLKENRKKIVYPDPQIYENERKIFDEFEMDIRTPFNFKRQTLKGRKIGLSISSPSKDDFILNGQIEANLVHLSEQITKQILSNGGTIIYGGDLRENGYTRLMFEEAKIAKDRLKIKGKNIESYIAWPRYCKSEIDLASIKADSITVATIEECYPPESVMTHIKDLDAPLPINDENYRLVNSICLTDVREKIVQRHDVAICIGGVHSGYSGSMPGILEEIYLSVKNNKPLYLLGGFGGLTKNVCDMILTKIIPKEFTVKWQIDKNEGYSKFLEKIEVDYENIATTLLNHEIKNGLSIEDNKSLFETQFVDEAIHLIFKGLNVLYGENDAI